MTEKKIIDAPAEQKQFTDERLNDKELDSVAGGFGGKFRSTDDFDDKTKSHTHGH